MLALFQRLDWLSLLDIGLVAIIFFWVLYLVRGTQAVPLLRGMIILLVVIAILGNTLTLPAFGWLFHRAVPALLVSIPVIFHPELRRAYQRLKFRRVSGVAKVAIARRLAVRLYWMLRARKNYAQLVRMPGSPSRFSLGFQEEFLF